MPGNEPGRPERLTVAELALEVQEGNKRTLQLTEAVDALNTTVKVTFGPKIEDLAEKAKDIVPAAQRRRNGLRAVIILLLAFSLVGVAVWWVHGQNGRTARLAAKVAAQQDTINRNQRFSNLGLCYTVVLITNDLRGLLDQATSQAQDTYHRTQISPTATAQVRADALAALERTTKFATDYEKTLPNIDCSTLPKP